jgi:hypothetical protein
MSAAVEKALSGIMTVGAFGYGFYCAWEGEGSALLSELNAARDRVGLKSAEVDWIAPGGRVLIASISGRVASEISRFHTHLRRNGWSLVGEEATAPRREEPFVGPAADAAPNYPVPAAS